MATASKSKAAAPQQTKVSADEARAALGEMLDRAWDGEHIVVTRHSVERGVLIGWKEYQRLIGEE